MKTFVLIRISLKFVSEGPIDKKPALVQVIARRLTGDKPLPERILTQFIDAYIAALEGDALTYVRLVATHDFIDLFVYLFIY